MIHEKVAVRVEGTAANAELYTYFLDNSREFHVDEKRPVVLICPGGGYEFTSDREAEIVAVQFLAQGFHAAVLRYSCAPAEYPAALLELAGSVLFLREHAEEYYIDADRIVVMGFSAGGHLAASFGCFWTESFIRDALKTSREMLRPDGLILCYPVITSGEFAHRDSFVHLLGSRYEQLVERMSLENQVNENVPKTFIWHTFTDEGVPVENSLLFVAALRKNGIPTEFHMYPVGGHGLSLANELTTSLRGNAYQEECQSWLPMACMWLRHLR